MARFRLTERIGRRPAIVVRVDGTRRLTLAPVSSAAMLSGAIPPVSETSASL